MTRTVLWRGTDPFSTELLHLEDDDQGWQLRGTVLVDLGGPVEVRYAVRADAGWRSRELHVQMRGAGAEAALDLVSDGDGFWRSEGAHIPQLDGCLDVDLGISPSTNTLPIRRLEAAVGDTVATRVAWVRFPELSVQPDDQTYHRLDERTWIFRSDDFVAELEVDADGLVVTYADLWDRVAASST